MKRIRLTESQFRKLITEALIEEAEFNINDLLWDSIMEKAKDVYVNGLKPIKDRHEEGWGRKDDGSEDYQKYSELWNKYCDLVKRAQQAFLKEYSDQGAIRAQDNNITNSVYQIIKKDPDYKAKGLYKEKFLFEPLLYLDEYKEMGNDSPRYKYLYIYQLGCASAYIKRAAVKVKCIILGKDREWDVSNYSVVGSPNGYHLSVINPNDSRKRAPQTRYVGQSTKKMIGNQRNRRVYYQDKEGNTVYPDNPNYKQSDAIEYFDNRYGEGDESLHGTPTGNRLYNFRESLMHKVIENVLRRLNNDAKIL